MTGVKVPMHLSAFAQEGRIVLLFTMVCNLSVHAAMLCNRYLGHVYLASRAD